MDITAIKKEIRKFLVLHLTSIQLSGNTEEALSDGTKNYKIAQSFIPFSTCYRPKRNVTQTNLPCTLYLVKHGTPNSGVKVSLQATQNSIPSGVEISSFKISPDEVYVSATEITKNFVLTDYLASKRDYNIVIEPEFTVSSANYISVIRNIDDENYKFGTILKAEANTTSWTTPGVDLKFKITTPGWIFTDYPRSDLNLKSYPRLVVDITSRRNRQKWISPKIVESEITLQLTAFSEHLDELDKIISYSDQFLFKFRNNFKTFYDYLGGPITRPSPARRTLMSRAIIATLKKRQTA